MTKKRNKKGVHNTDFNDPNASLKGIKVGIVDEFDIEELDRRNSRVQNLAI